MTFAPLRVSRSTAETRFEIVLAPRTEAMSSLSFADQQLA